MGISAVSSAAANWLGRVDVVFRREPPASEHLPASFGPAWREGGPLRLLVVFQLLSFWVSLNLMPLLTPDYDMFFHLAHGRWQDLNGAIPRDAYFSFFEPRVYVDYYWLFQRLIFELWQAGGYWGLLGLRFAVTTTFLAVLALFLFAGRRGGATLLSGLLVLSLVGERMTDVLPYIRPFVFSYLFLLLMLWILERRSRWLPLLPLISLLWINIHGVEHPVLLLVVFAYLGDELLAAIGRRQLLPEARRRLVWLGLCLPTLLFSPHGMGLVTFPFKSTALASYYVLEMKKATAETFSAFALGETGGVADYSGTLLLFVLALAALVRGLQRRQLRPAHLVLLLGACYLALQGFRFTSEFAILTLPLLSGGVLVERRDLRPVLATLLTVAVAALVWLGVASRWTRDSRGAWPLAFNDFPYLTCTFLEKVAPPGGKVWNSTNSGGGLLWQLDGRHRIAMDMEVQALFTDGDYFRSRVSSIDRVAFQSFVERYQPDWLAFNHDVAKYSGPFLRGSDFVPVAFDDSLVLLVDRRRHPELAAKWGLKALDPWRAKLDSDYHLSPDAVPEAERLFELEPRGLRLPALLAQAALGRHDFAAAERYVDQLIALAPQNADTWLLASSLQLQRGDLESAAAAVEMALKRVEPQNQNRLRGPLAHLLADSGREREALRQLRGHWKFYELMELDDLQLQVKLLERFGPPAEAAAARRVLELRRGRPLPPPPAEAGIR